MANGEKVLILEGNAEHASLLEQYVRMMGFEPRALHDGDAGRTAIARWQPDFLLTELDLPGTTGMQLLQELKADPGTAELPVVAMSEQKEEEVIVVTLSAGASDFLAKPILMAELTPKLQHALETKRYRAELRLANEQLEKEKQGLSRFFSEDVARQIISGEISTNLGGDSLQASIMFIDIRASTPLGERLNADQFAEFLSEVLGRFMKIIFAHQGSVNKLLGDGILATFGCPVATDRDTRNCVEAALAIRESLANYNDSRPDYLLENVRIGIGIATGRVFAGNVGTDERLEYTVIGDSVNLAARLEKMNKQLGSDILLCPDTRSAFGDELITEGSIRGRVRGKDEELTIYPLLDLD